MEVLLRSLYNLLLANCWLLRYTVEYNCVRHPNQLINHTNYSEWWPTHKKVKWCLPNKNLNFIIFYFHSEVRVAQHIFLFRTLSAHLGLLVCMTNCAYLLTWIMACWCWTLVSHMPYTTTSITPKLSITEILKIILSSTSPSVLTTSASIIIKFFL